ncbi:MAG: glycoside hydrolase family 3 C-terminal domain-containing protein [Bacteroidales bacterium]|nr:glycoside hydrolase family 3 C-terminal domain-containing protein [Bacteroidales bacterium]
MGRIKICRIPGIALISVLTILFISSCSVRKWDETEMGTIRIVTNRNGQTLGYSTTSGVTLLVDKGYAFKDLNKNAELDIYEDWRLSADERAADLASRLSVEEIAGLMLYSAHQSIPSAGGRSGAAAYNGLPYAESGALPSDLSDAQIEFLTNDNLRHVLITSVESPEVAALWNNNAQALCEGIGFGIPANNSSDPRHGTIADAEFNAGAGGSISMWPGPLGMAATFDPSVVKNFGEIASVEYRALGISTALSPQVDLATEPRWGRVSGTFGEDPQLAADMARAYIEGFQTSYGEAEIVSGWGYNSVNTMVKHWPGGGSGEGGRDAHYAYGKYAVYPGDNLSGQLIPFVNGAFNLEGLTGMASAAMPYYTISYNQDTVYNENVGNSYSKFIINDLLRETYNYDGVVCTDWGVTHDVTAIDGFGSTPWGAESLTEAERHYKIIMAGVDQFGGNNDADPVIEAYNLGVAEFGEEVMRARIEQSAVRLLKNIFRVGLFENPYLDVEKTRNTVGNPDYMQAGFDAQLKSIVLLKNSNNVLPLDHNTTVYIPERYIPPIQSMFGGAATEGSWIDPINPDIARQYFNITDNPDEADVALVMISSPSPGSGYSRTDAQAGRNGYIPMSLHYGPYRAEFARDPSLAGGDPLESFINRTYKDKTVTASNTTDLNLVLDTYSKMKGKPVIVSVSISNPMIFSEFEYNSSAIVANFSVQDHAILEIISGKTEPSGLLPFQMPLNMKVVEEQYEDVPHDMECHVDTDGNTYDFGFGLSWSGVIRDERTVKYKK